MIIVEFKQILNDLMYEHGYTNYRLAKEVGCSQTTIANWLKGSTAPQSMMYDKLADVFHVTVDYLKGATDIKRAPVQMDERDQDTLLQIARTTMLVQEFEKLSPEDQNDFLAQLIVKARTPADPGVQK